MFKSAKTTPFPFSYFLIAAFAVLIFTSASPIAEATETPENIPDEAGVTEQLDNQLDLGIELTDSSGKQITLADLYLPSRPLIIIPVYYSCPRLCGLTLKAATTVFNELDLAVGKDFTVAAVSFNPEEGSDLASRRALDYRAKLDPHHLKEGWHFLTGTATNTKALMDQIGFKFKKDGKDYSHSSVFVVTTGSGHVSRYFYGIVHDAKNLHLALVEAAQGKIGSTFDKVFLYCFRFDPSKGKYTIAIMNMVRLFSAITVFALVSLFIYLRRQERA